MNLSAALSILFVASASAFVPAGTVRRTSVPLYAGSNQNPFGNTASLEYTGGSDPNNKNYGKLAEKLNEADIER
eukprot:CAMPEP_0172525194 /NCGR_PEP_ID=MMETSP1067-20121228/225_1 /TAXON_ID=265564 ORGANISM="Thalassiosira punctigera, Strain Tpunct2005C2" /NCGR_SAMPLE_ID=MMETSP1067 /ASSEMBLY_ACC=CAM_ASM_000444 /LENGTH=73 /DNA_ID=CAMNT_0013308393 /DNA_START=1 /DNA_END=218 /DNA_ORIENTATION=-